MIIPLLSLSVVSIKVQQRGQIVNEGEDISLIYTILKEKFRQITEAQPAAGVRTRSSITASSAREAVAWGESR